jgi:hypothetical protein
MAVSSLTVARQRGIFTRFPVFAERQRRAFRRIFAKSRNNYAENLTVKEKGSQISRRIVKRAVRSTPPHLRKWRHPERSRSSGVVRDLTCTAVRPEQDRPHFPWVFLREP